MINETQDISGTAETSNMENVPVEPELDIAGEPVPIVLQPEPEVAKFVDPDKVPNVMLAPKGNAMPEGPVIIGRLKIELPDEDGQRAGFYTEHAGELVGQYPQFKFKVVKGENVPNVKL